MSANAIRQGRERSNGMLAQALRMMARKSGDQDAAILNAAADRLENTLLVLDLPDAGDEKGRSGLLEA